MISSIPLKYAFETASDITESSQKLKKHLQVKKAAATKIQSLFRGYKVRRDEAEKKEAEAEIKNSVADSEETSDFSYESNYTNSDSDEEILNQKKKRNDKSITYDPLLLAFVSVINPDEVMNFSSINRKMNVSLSQNRNKIKTLVDQYGFAYHRTLSSMKEIEKINVDSSKSESLVKVLNKVEQELKNESFKYCGFDLSYLAKDTRVKKFIDNKEIVWASISRDFHNIEFMDDRYKNDIKFFRKLTKTTFAHPIVFDYASSELKKLDEFKELKKKFNNQWTDYDSIKITEKLDDYYRNR